MNSDYKESIVKRIRQRQEKFNIRAERMVRRARKGVYGGERERLWLDQFTQGNGLDLFSGDFLVEDAIGIDWDKELLGVDFVMPVDHISRFDENSFDFVVTNYLEATPTPLSLITSVHRILKKGGIFAVACRNADGFDTPKGALSNSRRMTTFSESTLKHYLYRAGFSQVTVSLTSCEKAMRATAYK